MNTNGIGSSLGHLRVAQPEPRTQPRAGVPAPGTAPTPPAARGVEAETRPVEMPPGTDPELWKVLSTQERAFFAKVGAMGPLTYGRMLNSGMAPVTRGVRLDVQA